MEEERAQKRLMLRGLPWMRRVAVGRGSGLLSRGERVLDMRFSVGNIREDRPVGRIMA